jgi:hypothetical protein
VALGAFDLFEGLDIIVLGAVHDGEYLGDETGLTSGPLARGTNVSGLHRLSSFSMTDGLLFYRIRDIGSGRQNFKKYCFSGGL